MFWLKLNIQTKPQDGELCARWQLPGYLQNRNFPSTSQVHFCIIRASTVSWLRRIAINELKPLQDPKLYTPEMRKKKDMQVFHDGGFLVDLFPDFRKATAVASTWMYW